MAKERFFQDLRRAWGFRHLPPQVETDSPSRNIATLSRTIKNCDFWLSAKTVEEYRSEDFSDLDETLRNDLDRAVNEFRSAAEPVARNAAATDDQYHTACERFDQLTLVVRKIILPDWITSVASVVQEASTWCQEHGWPDRFYEKELTENILGTYRVRQLLFQADGGLIELSPVARFVPGALGLIELRVVPSYDTLKMIRAKDGWRINLSEGKNVHAVRVIPWNQPGFEQAVNWLRQQG